MSSTLPEQMIAQGSVSFEKAMAAGKTSAALIAKHVRFLKRTPPPQETLHFPKLQAVQAGHKIRVQYYHKITRGGVLQLYENLQRNNTD